MIHTTIRTLLLVAVFALIGLAPASAQTTAFDAEVDCAGIFAPGDTVPYTIRLENQTRDTIPLELTVEVFFPGRGTRTVMERRTVLRPNQDRAKDLSFRLPRRARPSTDYEIIFTASSDTETVFDTCSFDVQ